MPLAVQVGYGLDWKGLGCWGVAKCTGHTQCHACPHGLLVDAGCASKTGRQRIESVCTMQVFRLNTGVSCGRGQGFRGIYARKDSGETAAWGLGGPFRLII